MKKVLFIASHFCSGSTDLFNILDTFPKIMGKRSPKPYTDIDSIIRMTDKKHKLNNTAALWMDELLENYWLQFKPYNLNFCKFVYVIRPPAPTLNSIVYNKIYKPNCAVRYYCYRLQRLCEMAKRTPQAVLLTWDDMFTGRGLPLLSDYLGIDEIKNKNWPNPPQTNFIDYNLMNWADDCYNRCLNFLYNQNLSFYR